VLRRWDGEAKVAGLQFPPIDDYRDMLVAGTLPMA
jgi:hypothetical protein